MDDLADLNMEEKPQYVPYEDESNIVETFSSLDEEPQVRQSGKTNT